MAEGIIYSGSAISVADSKGRFVLPLDMRKLLKHSSGDTRLCLSIHSSLKCAVGFGLSHKQWLEDEVVEMERAARDNGVAFDGDAERERRFADVEDLNFDDGGRFFLPADIKRLIGIEDVIVFSGVSRYIQMWEPKTLLASDGRSPRLRAKVEAFLEERAAEGKA
ncbi:division/cell wall cluster transcriptional repressor MraZ [Sphingobium subterraneum]|uniref:MraZ protein n=1 Tax=Sphingobium subterraneum TaxID=627688 RepID=A0A841J5U5_9SPHN|nr:division/cell wall cluster transcriptional repressor MraZ [Sphingobium subterraneum]MBB6123591.1 MraZ protein [Sphingobium subterraneum]